MRRLLFFVCALLIVGLVQADDAFSLTGRISIRHQETAYHGTLSWQHSLNSDELVLAGPLGQGMAELRRTGKGAVLLLSDNERHEAETLDELAGQLFGAPLPIAMLPDWIRGTAPDAHLDELQRPRRLVLPDWTVEWLRYDENGRPLLLSLESPEVGVRLRIDSWSEPSAEAAP